jgi:hypothetical protein
MDGRVSTGDIRYLVSPPPMPDAEYDAAPCPINGAPNRRWRRCGAATRLPRLRIDGKSALETARPATAVATPLAHWNGCTVFVLAAVSTSNFTTPVNSNRRPTRWPTRMPANVCGRPRMPPRTEQPSCRTFTLSHDRVGPPPREAVTARANGSRPGSASRPRRNRSRPRHGGRCRSA